MDEDLIWGVAEPTVLMDKRLRARVVIGMDWMTILVCTWTIMMLFILAIFNACVIINMFTRIAGEKFWDVNYSSFPSIGPLR
uniref:Uncharacterized protein n=1 Tax=Lactuca sativa TaxID=4236 RepID=A0A9R1W9F8_LACSA|nr:hypothetical protein LSAT_V11C300123610 [Lactuca sativa]